MGLFSAACSRRHPFSRSYGVILPSSLTILLPPALGFSPHPPVSVYGTGHNETIAAFLTACLTASLLFSVRITPSTYAGFSSRTSIVLAPVSHSRLCLTFRVTTVLFITGAGISTCCPSTTHFCLALGPDLPRADQLYPGNLGYSAERILTFLSLLIPAFSLPETPQLLSVLLRRFSNAPLPILSDS